MMKSFLVFTICFLLLSGNSIAQQKSLKLSEALSSLESNAHQLKLLEKDLAMLKEQLAASKQVFLPQVGIAYTGVFTNSPLNAFGFKLNQEQVTQADFAPDVLNNPDVISNFNTKVQVMQPLFNYDASMAKDQLQYQTEALTQQQVHTLHYLQLQVKNTYTQLQFLYATQEVLQASEATMQAHEKIVLNFIEQGLAKTSDHLAIQVKLKEIENQQLQTTNGIQQLSAYLAYLIGDESKSIYQPTNSISENTMMVFTAPDSISSSRADLQAYQQGILAQQVGVNITKAQQIPRLNAFGEFNLNDASPIGFGGQNFMVGFSLTWKLPLGKQVSSQVNSQQIALEKSQLALNEAKQKGNMQLQQAIAQQQLYEAQLANMTTSLALAEEQLRITQNRFQEGLEKSADVLLAENQRAQVQLNIQQLKAKRLQNYYQLEFLATEN